MLRMTKLTNNAEQTWIALARSYRTILEEVERSFKRAGLPPLGWYDVLLEVERAGQSGIRPYALQKRLLLPQYGISRLLDRLEREGLIKKLQCEEDKRGFEVCITEKGQKIRQDMWPIYADALSRTIQSPMSPDALQTISKLLTPLHDA